MALDSVREFVPNVQTNDSYSLEFSAVVLQARPAVVIGIGDVNRFPSLALALALLLFELIFPARYSLHTALHHLRQQHFQRVFVMQLGQHPPERDLYKYDPICVHAGSLSHFAVRPHPSSPCESGDVIRVLPDRGQSAVAITLAVLSVVTCIVGLAACRIFLKRLSKQRCQVVSLSPTQRVVPTRVAPKSIASVAPEPSLGSPLGRSTRLAFVSPTQSSTRNLVTGALQFLLS